MVINWKCIECDTCRSVGYYQVKDNYTALRIAQQSGWIVKGMYHFCTEDCVTKFSKDAVARLPKGDC